MKSRTRNFFWGLVLILFGGFFLAVNLEWIPELSENLWAIVLGTIGLLFFAGYVTSEARNWGLLFPATIFGASAVVIWLENADVEGNFIGGLFMMAISIPFWVGYFANKKKNWGALIPAWITAIIGVIVLFSDVISGELIGGLVMFAVAIPFLVVYYVNRKHWWALIPAWVTATIGVIIVFSRVVSGELIGALVMFAVAIPFFVVYAINRQHWWALIPGWTTAVIGVVILFSNVVAGEWIGTLIMFGIALPFFVVYSLNRQHWWALIPAGVLTTVGAIILLSTIQMAEAVEVRVMGSVMFAGIGATFAVLWSLRHAHETEWAKFPALGFAAAALLVIIVGAEMELVWSVLMIGAGVWILARSPRPKEKRFKEKG